MSKIEFLNVARTGSGFKIKYRPNAPLDEGEILTADKKSVPHPNLIEAMQGITPHLVALCEFVSTKDIKQLKVDPKILLDYEFTGYEVIGSTDDPGFKLHGNKTLSTGRTITFKSPGTRFIEGDKTAYQFIDDLKERFSTLEKELLAYLKGKKGKKVQTEMFAEEEEQPKSKEKASLGKSKEVKALPASTTKPTAGKNAPAKTKK